MADFTRSLDKTRPVMAVLSRSYLKDNAAPALDIIGINRYFRFVFNLLQFLIINVLSVAETFTFVEYQAKGQIKSYILFTTSDPPNIRIPILQIFVFLSPFNNKNKDLESWISNIWRVRCREQVTRL